MGIRYHEMRHLSYCSETATMTSFTGTQTLRSLNYKSKLIEGTFNPIESAFETW
jgi:hypothetical protein